MNQKEKATELVNKIYQPMGYLKGLSMSSNKMRELAKERAIENVNKTLTHLSNILIDMQKTLNDNTWIKEDIKYWNDIKLEIIKL